MTPPRVVAITGAGGMVGSVVVDGLRDRYDLRPLHRDDADITDLEALERVFADVDAVVHLAATADVDSPWDAVLSANVIGVYNVYEAARRSGVDRVVFASSNHTVGMYQWDGDRFDDPSNPEFVPADAPFRPDSLYGASKVWGEALGRYYVERLKALSVVCLRIGWVTEDDTPPAALHADDPDEQRVRDRGPRMWLSHRDCVSLVDAALRADVTFATVFGVSENRGRWLSLEEGRDLLGWAPEDGFAGT